MNRYEPVTEDGVLYLVGDDDPVEIGPLDQIVAAIGGEEYVISYTDEQQTAAWVGTEDDGTITIGVREALTETDHASETVDELRQHDLPTAKHGMPERAVVFADTMVDARDQMGKG